MDKLKQKDLRQYREDLLQAQGHSCVLCGSYIKDKEANLDHDHSSGFVRAVLHRDCNVLLGKIENVLNTHGKRLRESQNYRWFFSKVAWYMENDWSTNPLHPKHDTEVDKEIKKLKYRIKVAKKEETKERLKLKIKELKNEQTKEITP